jgi:hypothetical protein
MLALATVLFAPMLASGEAFGRPVAGAVAPASLSVLVGAFVFAIGMQLGGGCGSGTLYHVGVGSSRLVLTLLFFVVGAVLATFHMPFWTALPSLGEISLGERLGSGTAVALRLAVCGLLAVATLWVDRRRGLPASPRTSAPPGGWWRILQGPWSLVAGGVLLALLNLLTLLVAGHPWTITWAFALWGGKALALSGYDLSAIPFWTEPFQQHALAAPVLADATSVMDIGLVLGAFLGGGLAGRVAPKPRVPLSRLAASGVRRADARVRLPHRVRLQHRGALQRGRFHEPPWLVLGCSRSRGDAHRRAPAPSLWPRRLTWRWRRSGALRAVGGN